MNLRRLVTYRVYPFIITFAVLCVVLASAAEESKKVHLRSEPQTVAKDEGKQVFGLTTRKFDWGTSDGAPREYVSHQYEDRGEVVIDHTTVLMWQKYSSPNYMSYEDAQKYVEQLNHQRFAGFANWRLPTIPELMSLLEPTRKNGGLYIDPIFDKTHNIFLSEKQLVIL